MQNQIKVLLVDDEDRFCETTSKLLNKKGFDTAIANNAEKAIHILKDTKRDVIVLDIQMTGMDGHTALHEIKKTDPDIQVIILTGHGSRYSAMRALVREAFDYLAKPCDIEILASRIQDAYLAKNRGFKFDDKKALNIMIPIHDLKSISADMSVKEAMSFNDGFLAVKALPDHGHPFFHGEQGLFGRVVQYGNDDLVKDIKGAFNDINMSVGQRIKGTGVDGNFFFFWPWVRHPFVINEIMVFEYFFCREMSRPERLI